MNFSRSFLFILSFLAGISASAQGFYKAYAPATAKAQDVVQTDDGGYFMTGHVAQDSLLFLQRVSTSGQVVWTNHFNFNHAKGIAAAKAADGGFVVLTEFYADTNGYKNAVLKVNATGAATWSTIIDNNFLPNGLRDIVATPDGGFMLVGDTRDSSLNSKNWLVKLAADGSISWKKTFGISFLQTCRIVELPTGNFAISGGRNGGDISLATVSPSGDLLWQTTFAKAEYQKSYDLLATTDGGIAVLGTTQSQGRLELCVLKTDLNGAELWFKHLFPYDVNNQYQILLYANSFAQDLAGNYYIPLWNGLETQELLKLNSAGDHLWKRETGVSGYANAIIHTSDNYFALAGADDSNAFLLKTDTEAEIFSNRILGTVFRDENIDCTLGAAETGLANFILKAQAPSGESFYKKTNVDGSYEIRLPEGDFELFVTPSFGPVGLYSQCDTPQITVVGINQLINNQNVGVEAVAECPLLEVEIGGGILRRCVSTRYTVSWCNYGNLIADNPSIQITADTALEYVGSGLPLVSQNGNIYTFNIPDVPVGVCNSFYVDFLVKCAASVGDVICIEAHAFPDTSCLPPGAAWDGSELEVSGTCEGNELSFKIKNKGNAAMTQNLDYVIIEDHIMYMQGQIKLGAGNDTTIVVSNPNGACYLGKLLNTNNTSIISHPTAVVENCIAGGNLDLALQFETGENNYAISTNCAAVVGSFDPNDKTGFPLGWNDEHLLERNQDIEYLIRFQNTGNDTAFLVVIRDTLPLATLDPGSLRPVAASHPYTWDVTGTGIATFTFANILLPDSSTNEPASHGFVRFRIRQQPDLADGTRIKNNAAIYFDFNEPVITNEYFHTIGKIVVVATHNPSNTQLLDYAVSPNPFSREATFVLKNYTPKSDVTFRLINALGNVVREERFPGNSFLFNAKNLATGLYFFQIEENGALLATGKVAISQ